jgi:hypothetical protein
MLLLDMDQKFICVRHLTARENGILLILLVFLLELSDAQGMSPKPLGPFRLKSLMLRADAVLIRIWRKICGGASVTKLEKITILERRAFNLQHIQLP